MAITIDQHHDGDGDDDDRSERDEDAGIHRAAVLGGTDVLRSVTTGAAVSTTGCG